MNDFDPRRRLSDQHLNNQTDRMRNFLDRPRPLDTFSEGTGNGSHTSNSNAWRNTAPITVWRKIAGLLMLLGPFIVGSKIRYETARGAEKEAWLSFTITATGYILAIAPLVIIAVFFENVARVLYRLFIWMLAMIVLMIAASIAIQFFAETNFLHVRDWLEPLRETISPAVLLKHILPAPMAPAAWPMAFSAIVTFATLSAFFYESEEGPVLSSFLIVVGCFLFL